VTRRRWWIPVLLLVIITIDYMDRSNMSVAIPFIAKQFHFSPAVEGVLLSSFLWSYIPMILLWGWLADRWGSGTVIALSSIIWSLTTFLTGIAASFGAFLGARLGLGVGEAGAFPAASRAVAEWSPATERGVAMSVYNAGLLLGPAFGTLAAAALVHAYGWPAPFFVFAGLGVVAGIVWYVVYRPPEKARWLPAEEREHILATRDVRQERPVVRMSILRLLGQGPMWGILITQGCLVYTLYLFLTWLPSYLYQARHLSLIQVGWFGALPYFIGTVLSILIGLWSDRLMRGRDVTTGSRRYLLIVMMFISAVVLLEPFVSSFALAETILIVSQSTMQAALNINYALTTDLLVDKESAGVTFGLGVVGGNIFGFLAPLLTGLIIQATHSYTAAFVLAGLLLVAGALVCWALSRRPLQPLEALRPAGAAAAAP
jgi:MFS family permease